MNRLIIIVCLLIVEVTVLQAQSNVSAVNSTAVEHAPVVSNDGKYLVFQSNRNKGFKLYESQKQGKAWTEAKAIDNINEYTGRDLTIIGSPYFSADGKTLFYAAVFEDSYGDLDIYYSTRKNDTWSKPEHLSNLINSTLPETAPSINPTGDTLFFVRKGTDPAVPACGKVYFSVKADDKWTAALLLPATQSDCYTRYQQTYANGYYWADAKAEEQLSSIKGTTTSKQETLTTYMNTVKSNHKTSWITPKEDELIYVYNGDILTAPLAYNTHIKGTSYAGIIKDAENGTVLTPAKFVASDSSQQEINTVLMAEDGSYKLYIPAGYRYKAVITADKYDTLIKEYTVDKGEWLPLRTKTFYCNAVKRKWYSMYRTKTVERI